MTTGSREAELDAVLVIVRTSAVGRLVLMAAGSLQRAHRTSAAAGCASWLRSRVTAVPAVARMRACGWMIVAAGATHLALVPFGYGPGSAAGIAIVVAASSVGIVLAAGAPSIAAAHADRSRRAERRSE
jgi:hypothetical protein